MELNKIAKVTNCAFDGETLTDKYGREIKRDATGGNLVVESDIARGVIREVRYDDDSVYFELSNVTLVAKNNKIIIAKIDDIQLYESKHPQRSSRLSKFKRQI